jgi:acid phosphatase (class A)
VLFLRTFLALALSVCGAAAQAPHIGPVQEVRPPSYIDGEELAASLAFPSPPEPGSRRDRADFAGLHAWQIQRTEAECARARSEKNPTYEAFFGDSGPYDLPLSRSVKLIFLGVAADVGVTVTALKHRYKRKRPFKRDRTLKPCIPEPGGKAYPSGHAALGRVYALMLADLVPARRTDYRFRGDEIALDRVIAGVHHPTDIEAGKYLGDEIYARLRKNSAFKKAMKRLRSKLPRAGAAPAGAAGPVPVPQ